MSENKIEEPEIPADDLGVNERLLSGKMDPDGVTLETPKQDTERAWDGGYFDPSAAEPPARSQGGEPSSLKQRMENSEWYQKFENGYDRFSEYWCCSKRCMDEVCYCCQWVIICGEICTGIFQGCN